MLKGALHAASHDIRDSVCGRKKVHPWVCVWGPELGIPPCKIKNEGPACLHLRHISKLGSREEEKSLQTDVWGILSTVASELIIYRLS